MVKGIVKNITDYGAFVDLGGIDGLLHITDLAWRRVSIRRKCWRSATKSTAKVLKFDQEKNRVSLGLKQLGEDPWVGISRRYPPGTRLFGKVTNLTDYGAFVEIESGIEGLVHVSEMDWTNKNVHPVARGAGRRRGRSHDPRDRRGPPPHLAGHEAVHAQPVGGVRGNYKKGDKVKGQIKSITDFGVFIGLPGGIDGLVHLSDLSWTSAGRGSGAQLQEGRRGRGGGASPSTSSASASRSASSSSKAIRSPTTSRTHDKGSVVDGKVKSVDAKGAVVALDGDVEGYLRASEVARDRVEDIRTHLKEGDAVNAMIINIDRKNRTINLSIKAEEHRRGNRGDAEARCRDARPSAGTTNLGALLKAKLDNKNSTQ